MANAKLVAIPGAGHLAWLDEPRSCAIAMQDHLAAAMAT
jgi:pimeloyl-ACP methyl ester carboxylesterase